jgi:hypothetical protein
MKSHLIFFLALLFTSQGYGKFKNCDLSLHKSAKYTDGEYPFHEYQTSHGTVVVGGVGEVHPPNMDHLAAQRAIGSCAPGILKCIKESKTALPIQILISFQLNPIREEATGSDYQVHFQGETSQDLRKCIEKILPEAEFGLILKKSVHISMPVKIQSLL